jgi:putative Ca2+/H+ antiporter (TMEM165/GDT1 family)
MPARPCAHRTCATIDVVDAFLLSAAVIFIAEFGDKSQLLVLGFATRFDTRWVILGVVVGAAVVQGISVAIGATVGAALPEAAVGIVAGLAFLGVAAWTLRGEDDEPGAEAVPTNTRARSWYAVSGLVAVTFFLAELGDKTMLATFALAARQPPLVTWLGTTLGEVAANLIAVAIGHQLGSRLSPRAVRIGSAALFAIAGVLVLVDALA